MLLNVRSKPHRQQAVLMKLEGVAQDFRRRPGHDDEGLSASERLAGEERTFRLRTEEQARTRRTRRGGISEMELDEIFIYRSSILEKETKEAQPKPGRKEEFDEGKQEGDSLDLSLSNNSDAHAIVCQPCSCNIKTRTTVNLDTLIKRRNELREEGLKAAREISLEEEKRDNKACRKQWWKHTHQSFPDHVINMMNGKIKQGKQQ